MRERVAQRSPVQVQRASREVAPRVLPVAVLKASQEAALRVLPVAVLKASQEAVLSNAAPCGLNERRAFAGALFLPRGCESLIVLLQGPPGRGVNCEDVVGLAHVDKEHYSCLHPSSAKGLVVVCLM